MEIRSPGLMYLKAALFVVAGSLAVAIILLDRPTLEVAALLVAAVWCFARAYYFAFYVVQQYADPGYRFAGLWSFAEYLWRRHRRGGGITQVGGQPVGGSLASSSVKGP